MQFDAIIIGSGQAGNPLAARLAKEKWKVAIVERGEFGGTCINNGCTPTKTLAYRAQIAYYVNNSDRWGVEREAFSVNFTKIMEQKAKVVSEWRDSVKEELKDPHIKVIQGEAKFVGPHEIEVGGQHLTSEKIFINTGARPTVPPIPGLDGTPFLTNISILELKELPESLVIIGGGYIGLEFAQMFARFGTKVTVLEKSGQLVAHEDADVAEELTRALKEELAVCLNTKVKEVSYDGQFKIDVGSDSLTCSHLLLATGRTPNSEALNLAAAGVEVTERGAIGVNEKLETNVPGIWALGDVNGGPAFTHISYNDFQIVEANLLDGGDLSTKDRQVPYCVFTDPQLGGFGMTEKAARKTGRSVKVGKLPMSDVARAYERDETAGLMKLVVDGETDRILGATILGVEGGEVLQILSVFAQTNLPYTQLKSTIWIHPTLAEGLFRLVRSVE